jgi:hypothetical protein
MDPLADVILMRQEAHNLADKISIRFVKWY